MALVAASSAVAARVRLRVLLLRLTPLLSFAVVTSALLLVAPTPPGTPTTRVLLTGQSVPQVGVEFILGLMVKSVLVVVLASAFTRWLSERDLLAGLIGLRVPATVAALLYLMVRSLRDVRNEAGRLLRARDARGTPRGVRAVRVAAAMAQVLLIRLGQRADLRAAGLVSRGFDGRFRLVSRP